MRLPPTDDTIAAIATAPGVGAVGIVRLSGPESYTIANKFFRARSGDGVLDLAAARVVYGVILEHDELIDEALLLTFRAPHSYTTQDVLELQTHGGPAVLRRVLQLCLDNGARLAQPGEFTLRAYLNGRLDLVQAESVLGIVNAQSDTARRSAALGLSKELSEQLALIQEDLTAVYGDIQAVFDYPDEGVPEAQFAAPLKRAVKRIDDLLATAKAGQLAQKGAKLALIGKPNAGKSSLLNALLGFERSIVSDVPGTTRDYLEAPLELGGVPITAIDTAGIRQTEDAIEASGVNLARSIAKNADLSLYLLEGSEPLDFDESLIEEGRSLLVVTKTDLPSVWTLGDLGKTAYPVSVKTGDGLDELKNAVRDALIGDAGNSELWLSNERHADALRRVRTLALQAKDAPDDLAALDLEEALRTLAEITGQGDIAEDALAHIFANFCVGK